MLAQTSKRQSGVVHLLLIIVILTAIAAGLYIINNRKQQPLTQTARAQDPQEVIPESPAPQSTNATYKNDKYGYSFEYFKDYHVYISPPDFVFVKKEKTDKTDLVDIATKHNSTLVYPNPEKFVSRITNLKDVPFEEYTAKSLLPDCASLDVDQEYYCDAVVSQDPYTNKSGLTGYKVYLHLVHASRDRNSRRTTLEEATWGPVYILDLTDRQISDVRALVFKPQLDLHLDTKAADLEIKKIVDTVKF